MPSSILPQHLNRLSIKIPLAILALMALLGVSLYFLVLRSVNEFASYQIHQDLEEVASQVYDIIDRGYTSLLKTSAADDIVARRLRQVDDQDLIERFASDRHIEVVISHAESGQLIMSTPGLKNVKELLPLAQDFPNQLSLAGSHYYARQMIFSPWNWKISLLKNQAAYAELSHRVKQTYQGAILVCIIITVLIIFLLQGQFRAPITSIIDRLKENKYPDYQGTQEFTYLSNAITSMMTNQRQQMRERREQEEQRRELEEKLHQSQKMEAIGLMAGGC